MSKYLVLYRSDVSAADQMTGADPESAAESMRAWMEWAERAGEAIVDLGAPTQSVSGGGSGPYIGGYSIMQAATLDALESILADHPHRGWGGTIEVLEILDLPSS